MKKVILLVVVAFLLAGGAWWWNERQTASTSPLVPGVGSEEQSDVRKQNETIAPSVVVDNLDVPWDVAFLPDGSLLVTERSGDLLHIVNDRVESELAIPEVDTYAQGESGLLGITLHPDFSSNNWLYLYVTESGSAGITNRVMRYSLVNGELTEAVTIIENIPGAAYHDGGRIDFGPDGYLYIATGDASSAALAQDISSLAGKILRVGDNGDIPSDNPFSNAVYSYGHRNPQGLTWDNADNLWATEHGRSGATSGLDEVNLIRAGDNYGWPTIEGDETAEGLVPPVAHSGARDTWAPASAVYWDGSIFFGGLRGEALYEAVLNGEEVTEVRAHFKGEYGRVRTVRLGPDGMFYLTTSNQDGRGNPTANDDRLIRLDPRIFR